MADGLWRRILIEMDDDRVFPLADAADVFVFWLGDGPESTSRNVTKSTIDRDNLIYFSSPELIVPTHAIRLVHAGVWGSGVRRRVGTWCVTVQTDCSKYEFWPVNPMEPQPSAYGNRDEAHAFQEVLKALQQHRKPTYDRNPYVRQQVLRRRRRIRMDLESEVSPMVYREQWKLWLLPERWAFLVFVGIVVGAWALFMSLILMLVLVFR